MFSQGNHSNPLVNIPIRSDVPLWSVRPKWYIAFKLCVILCLSQSRRDRAVHNGTKECLCCEVSYLGNKLISLLNTKRCKVHTRSFFCWHAPRLIVLAKLQRKVVGDLSSFKTEKCNSVKTGCVFLRYPAVYQDAVDSEGKQRKEICQEFYQVITISSQTSLV